MLCGFFGNCQFSHGRPGFWSRPTIFLESAKIQKSPSRPGRWSLPSLSTRIPGGEDDVEEAGVEDDAEGDEGQVDSEQEPVQLRRHLAVVVHLLHLLQINVKGESAEFNRWHHRSVYSAQAKCWAVGED